MYHVNASLAHYTAMAFAVQTLNLCMRTVDVPMCVSVADSCYVTSGMAVVVVAICVNC